MLKFAAVIIAVVIGLSSYARVANADNPHCNGNSDNVHLPNQHTQQNFPGC